MKRMILELNVPGAEDLQEAWSGHPRPERATAGAG
jgi:hypothetical protein